MAISISPGQQRFRRVPDKESTARRLSQSSQVAPENCPASKECREVPARLNWQPALMKMNQNWNIGL
jgi:hypothetical protein